MQFFASFVVASVAMTTVLLLLSTSATGRVSAASTAVGFASCNRHTLDQSYWTTIQEALGPHPDGFVWLGDVVYNDVKTFPSTFHADSIENIERTFVEFRNSPQYANFVASVRRDPQTGAPLVTGVWDDHDMGLNDAGEEFWMKRDTQQLFLDFLGVSKTSPRRRREGVYHVEAFRFDESNNASSSRHASLQSFERAICTVLLDVRYHRSPLGSDGDMLGEEQWTWLDRILADPSAELGTTPGRSLSDVCAFTMIGSGVQVLADEKPTEHWGHFPTSRARLLTMLHAAKAERFMFVSGDVHYTEIQAETDSPFGFPLYDVTSSGLTHSISILPNWLFDTFCGSPRRLGRYLNRNFGRVTLDESTGVVRVATHSLVTGAEVLHLSMPLRDLAFKDPLGARQPCGKRCTLPVHQGRLKAFLWTLREAVAPELPVHKLLLRFVVSAWVVVGLGALLLLRLIVRRLRRSSSAAASNRPSPPTSPKAKQE